MAAASRPTGKMRSKDQRSRSHSYEKGHVCMLLVKGAAAAAAGMGLHVDRTALVSSSY